MLKNKFNVDHAYQLTWQGGQNSPYSKAVKWLEEKPGEIIQHYSEKISGSGSAREIAKPKKESGDTMSFADALRECALECGMESDDQINFELQAEFSCTIDTAKAEDYGTIIDHFAAIHQQGQQ